ncbi:MAG: group 1 truncated hemoglobin [Tepidisphaeraceae bacterium]|jgi:hemoglobin
MVKALNAAKSAARGIVLAAAILATPVAVFTATGCTSNTNTPAPKSLYDRLGGDPAISAVVDDFVNRAAADPAVNFTRKGVEGAPQWDPTPENVAILKKHLTEFIEVATGGPQTYEGRPDKDVHKGMKITDAEFNAIAADLVASLNKFNVPQQEQNDLIAVVKTTYPDVVQP